MQVDKLQYWQQNKHVKIIFINPNQTAEQLSLGGTVKLGDLYYEKYF